MKNIIVTLLCLSGLMLIQTARSLAESIFLNHNGHHSYVAKRDIQETSNIPLDVISQLNNIENFDDLQNFINEESLKAAGIQFSDLNTSISNRIGESDGNAPVVPKYVKCMPELQVVELNVFELTLNEVYYPRCVLVEQCGGCCTHISFSCQPTRTKQLSFQVIVLGYNESIKFNYRRKEIVAVEQHLECICDCINKETGCSSIQEYRKKKCSCGCPDTDEKRLCLEQSDFKTWDSQNCVCLCNETVENCGPDYTFSQVTCSCEFIKP